MEEVGDTVGAVRERPMHREGSEAPFAKRKIPQTKTTHPTPSPHSLRHSREACSVPRYGGGNPRGNGRKGSATAPFVEDVRGREQAKRCERGMPVEAGNLNQLQPLHANYNHLQSHRTRSRKHPPGPRRLPSPAPRERARVRVTGVDKRAGYGKPAPTQNKKRRPLAGTSARRYDHRGGESNDSAKHTRRGRS